MSFVPQRTAPIFGNYRPRISVAVPLNICVSPRPCCKKPPSKKRPRKMNEDIISSNNNNIAEVEDVAEVEDAVVAVEGAYNWKFKNCVVLLIVGYRCSRICFIHNVSFVYTEEVVAAAVVVAPKDEEAEAVEEEAAGEEIQATTPATTRMRLLRLYNFAPFDAHLLIPRVLH